MPVVKNPPANAEDRRDEAVIPESGRSPGEGHGNPLLYSCLENPIDRGAWRTTQSLGSQRAGHSWSNLDLTHISSLPDKQVSAVTPWILLPPGFRALICSEASIFWWIQDKSLIFSLFSFISCDQERQFPSSLMTRWACRFPIRFWKLGLLHKRNVLKLNAYDILIL